MGACSVEKLECTPEFDMMGFMELSQETRVDGKVMNKMTTLWDEWLKKLSVYKVVCGKISYLLVWLPEEVETYVDETWDKTPSEGYLANSLAQYLCMQSRRFEPPLCRCHLLPLPRWLRDLSSAKALPQGQRGFGLHRGFARLRALESCF